MNDKAIIEALLAEGKITYEDIVNVTGIPQAKKDLAEAMHAILCNETHNCAEENGACWFYNEQHEENEWDRASHKYWLAEADKVKEKFPNDYWDVLHNCLTDARVIVSNKHPAIVHFLSKLSKLVLELPDKDSVDVSEEADALPYSEESSEPCQRLNLSS